MTPDFVPRPDETFDAWFRRVDSATHGCVHQSEPLGERTAYVTGASAGVWATLFDCFKLLGETNDARKLLTLALAGELGLRNRRDAVRTVDQFITRLDGPASDDSDECSPCSDCECFRNGALAISAFLGLDEAAAHAALDELVGDEEGDDDVA
jgi:hypothetical protein